MPNPIVLVPYDPSWPTAFKTLRYEIAGLLDGRLKETHHVGSTAVPGLAAKPKIDLIVELASDDFIDAALARIQALQAYQFHGDPYGDGLWTFARGHGSYGARLYICGPDNPMMRRWIRFRDRLRTDAVLRYNYECLKRRLITTSEGDWRRYTGGKSTFIDAALDVAKT
jgi:GrpB-like predicted nucleotidyltransferase (UPF0157 family)